MALFRRRSSHALLILGNLVYLQFCIRALQGLVCTNGRLRVEPSTICYGDKHVYAIHYYHFIIILIQPHHHPTNNNIIHYKIHHTILLYVTLMLY